MGLFDFVKGLKARKEIRYGKNPYNYAIRVNGVDYYGKPQAFYIQRQPTQDAVFAAADYVSKNMIGDGANFKEYNKEENNLYSLIEKYTGEGTGDAVLRLHPAFAPINKAVIDFYENGVSSTGEKLLKSVGGAVTGGLTGFLTGGPAGAATGAAAGALGKIEGKAHYEALGNQLNTNMLTGFNEMRSTTTTEGATQGGAFSMVIQTIKAYAVAYWKYIAVGAVVIAGGVWFWKSRQSGGRKRRR
jgi:hypothetical protein